mgnify:FL=1
MWTLSQDLCGRVYCDRSRICQPADAIAKWLGFTKPQKRKAVRNPPACTPRVVTLGQNGPPQCGRSISLHMGVAGNEDDDFDDQVDDLYTQPFPSPRAESVTSATSATSTTLSPSEVFEHQLEKAFLSDSTLTGDFNEQGPAKSPDSKSRARDINREHSKQDQRRGWCDFAVRTTCLLVTNVAIAGLP